MTAARPSGLDRRVRRPNIRTRGSLSGPRREARSHLRKHRPAPRASARASHANGARRRRGARESVWGSPRGESPSGKTSVTRSRVMTLPEQTRRDARQGGVMTPRIDEVAPDLYRISVYVPQFDLQFNHFLVRDDEPLLFHTGMRGMFPAVREAVAALIPPESLRWISWSHFEVDECGALNEWLAIAPKALPVCGELGAMINIGDFSNRPPRALKPDEIL